MNDSVENRQREALFNVLDEAMVVLRDNKPFNPDNPAFGKIRSLNRDAGYPGGVYVFKNEALPPARMTFATTADPLDYSDDRMNVPVVPAAFEILLTGSLIAVSRSLLEKRLDLADYWIDSDTGERKANEMGPGYYPFNSIRSFRYRARDHANTRVPVDVNLDYAEPDSSDLEEPPKLLHVTIERAYEILTPEQRKQKREEKEQRARDLYGNPGATK